MATNTRVLRIREVLEIVSISKATLYRWVADGAFPRQIKLGPRVSGWSSESIEQWLAAKAAS